MAEPFVSFQGVSKFYKSFKALDDVSFELAEGEVFGYIGPNGAGKTTTLKLLVGLFADFKGEVRIGKLQLPRDHMQIHQLVGYLPQAAEFQSWRTVDQALMTFGRLSGVPDATLKERIPALLERFDLGNARHKKVKKLSGGMKQKVGFVQALLHSPKLLVLDEPLSALDPQGRIEVKNQISRLKEEGTTVIFSSHILGDIQDVADRMGIIYQGKMQKAGTLLELKDHFGVMREVHISYAELPQDIDFLREHRLNIGLRQKGEKDFIFEIERSTSAAEVVDSLIRSSLEKGGKILSIGEVRPSLDELYARFAKSITQNPEA